ncbi:MAG: PAS domain S-box protein [Deltaproteobacteria bacterium]|nr:PAS domain S-box protein [Deltaproteobacteria bacterium]
MKRQEKTRAELLAEIADLERRLADSEDTLEAIRNGEVDAIYVEGPVGDQVFTLKGANHTYRTLIEEMNQGAVTTTQDRTILYVNPAFAKLLQRPPQGLVGTALDQYIGPESEPVFETLCKEGFQGGARGEIALAEKAGGSIPVYASMNRVLLEDEPILCIAVTDLREQKRQEAIVQAERFSRAVLEASEELFSKAFHSAPFLMSISSIEQGEFFEVNDTFCRVTGYEREEIIGSTSVDLVFLSREDRQRLNREIAQNGRVRGVEVELRKKSGEFFTCLYFAEVISLKQGRRLLSIAEDITERRQVEADRTRLMTAIEQMDEIVVITDARGNIQYVNPAFERITGYTRHDAVGKNPRILKSGVQDEAFYQGLWQTIKSGKSWKNRMVNRRKDGALYTDETSITPVLNVQGDITNFVAVKRDITAEIEMERRLAQAQKMEAIGTLAAGIAHDFNNILSPILVDSEMVLMQLSDESPLQVNLRRINNAGERARELVRQILAFARAHDQELVAVKVTPLIKESVKFLRSSIPSTIEIRSDLDIDQDTVMADPTQLHQVVMNLCTNAAHAMAETGGRLDIVLTNETLGSRLPGMVSELTPGRYLKLSVADTGPGIDPGLQKKIFEPYFTTKAPGKGTGMGLSLVHGIVERFEGTVAVQSEPGRGARFEVYLPLMDEESQASKRMTGSVSDLKGNERILLIDDESWAVEAIRPMLEKLGYHVTGRTRSIEALEEFRNNPDGFDLVITDMTMPRMTGKGLAREMLKIRPEIPIILCTGFSEQIDEKTALKMGIRAYVMKPIIMHQMARTIRQVLGSLDAGNWKLDT